MTRIWIFLCLLGCTSIVSSQTHPVNGTALSTPKVIAFTHASILLADGSTLTNGTLLISGDKILELGKSVTIPEDAIVYDLTGQTILPSFVELNSSIGIPKAESNGGWSPRPQIESKKQGAYYWNESIHPEVDAATLYKSDEKAIDELRKMGYSVALTHLADGIAQGTGTLVALDVKDENKVLLQSYAGQFFSLEKGVSRQTYPSSQMGSIALLRQVFYDLDWYTKSTQRETDLSLEALERHTKLPMFFKTTDKWEIL